MKQGQCLSYIKDYADNPYKAIHPILSTNFYEGKRTLRNVERLVNPNDYQLQFGRFAILHFLCDMYSSISGGISLSHFATYASKLFCLGTDYKNKTDYIGKLRESGEDYFVSMFTKIDLLFYTTGPMTGFLYQKPFRVATLSLQAGSKKDASHMARMMFSVPLSDGPDAAYRVPERKKIERPDARKADAPVVVVEDETVGAAAAEPGLDEMVINLEEFIGSDLFAE